MIDNTKRLRLTALVQSYDMMSSEQFLSVQQISKLMEASDNSYSLRDEGDNQQSLGEFYDSVMTHNTIELHSSDRP